jgi:Reverse transcriptase (RNA-dependent DNA polymerase)
VFVPICNRTKTYAILYSTIVSDASNQVPVPVPLNVQMHPSELTNDDSTHPCTQTRTQCSSEPTQDERRPPRPQRNTHLPSRYSDYVASNVIVNQLLQLDDDELCIPLDDDLASLTDIIPYILEADSAIDLSINQVFDDEHDPPTVRHAQRSKYWNEWLAAMHEELEALKAKGVYEEVEELPPGRRAVQCKWVLRIKRDKSGNISRFKGRLVAKGFTQISGQDFTFTFAPVARWDSIRAVLCISTLNDFELRHVDVKNAYLNAPLLEEIYMYAPDGSGCKYWRLLKGLYGLRQAGRQWYLLLHDTYTDFGYTRCQSDWSVYLRKSPSAITISATSVDDLLIASNSKAESNLATSQLQSKFPISDGGDIEWLLGCRIRRWRNRRLLMIDQEQFTTRILTDFGMENCNSVKTPCPTYRLTMDMCPKTIQEREAASKLPYCAIVGKCMYLSTCTRPDISFAVRELAKFMSNYGARHYEAAKHLLRYLQGTRSRGIIYGNMPNPYPLFIAFADSDWAMSEGRKSVSGYIIECANGPITWSSKQQSVVALSSCEAEYLSCSHGARQVLWLRSLFEELGFNQNTPTPLYCDNQGTVTCTHDPQSHSRMKHIDIRAHFIRDCVNNRLIDVHHIPGTENPADLLTKPLLRPTHQKWLERINLDKDDP